MISCIYKIINLTNNKFYIGSTVNLDKRINEHLRKLKKDKHHSSYLQNAYNKYGKDSFIFHILELCDDVKKLRELEQLYMTNLNPVYNMSKSSTAPMDGRKHSEESRKKMGEWKRPSGPDNHLYGKTWTDEKKKEFSKLRKDLNYKHPEETRSKMSETSKRLNRFQDIAPYIEKLKERILDSIGNIFNSMSDTAKYHEISVQTVCDILKRRHHKTNFGVTFNYVDKENLPYYHTMDKGLYRGIYKRKKRWIYYITLKDKTRQQKAFATEKEAIDAYRELYYTEYGIKLCERTISP